MLSIYHQGQSSSTRRELAVILLSRLRGWGKELIIIIVMVVYEDIGQFMTGTLFSFVCVMTDMTRPTPVRLIGGTCRLMDYWPGLRSKTPARFGHHFSFAFAFPWIILYFLFFLSSPLQKEQLLYTITTLQSEFLVSFIFISLSPSLSPFISPPTPSMLHVVLLLS